MTQKVIQTPCRHMDEANSIHPMKIPRRIIQIATGQNHALFALCEDGSIWVRFVQEQIPDSKWFELDLSVYPQTYADQPPIKVNIPAEFGFLRDGPGAD
jgi:hypothetical protein